MHKHFYEDILQILDEAFNMTYGCSYKEGIEEPKCDADVTLNNCAHTIGHVVDNLLALIQDDDLEFDLEEFNTWVRSGADVNELLDD